MKQYRILVDMDEVLADFTGSALAVHGWTREQFEAERKPGVWDMTKTMGLTDQEFWNPINEIGQRFWEQITPLPTYKEIMKLVQQFTTDWFIVSSPSFCLGCIPGKQQWLSVYFGLVGRNRLIPTSYKHVMANDFTILIDDNEDNLKKFTEAGGHGILFPTKGNSLYKISDNPVEHVKVMLERFAYNASTL